jgi:hypothetical protein
MRRDFKKRRVFSIVLIILPALLCAGCVSLMEKTGRVLDGSAFAEKKIARYRARKKKGAAFDMELLHASDKAGQRLLVITQNKFPAVQIRGTEPNAENAFYVRSVDYISGNTSGWNQYSLELSGSGTCVLGDSTAIISLNNDIEKVQISRGKIRRFDTTITDSEALTNLRNREERIESLVEWMKERENAPHGLDRKAFQAYWKPILVPEICPKRKRPAGWRIDGDIFIRAEDIKWNTGYTERVFPETLRPVRDSGTLLRDWEEALEWVYLQYEWETLTAMLSREITLKRVK